MGQQEIYDFLKDKRRDWLTSKEISAGLDVSIGSVTNCLRKLRESGAVQFKESGHRNQFIYRFKR